MKQTGLIIEHKTKDYILGVSSPLVWDILIPTADWTTYKPTDEKQYLEWTFDTLSCATFSSLNALEHICNYLMVKGKFTATSIKWLQENGYMVEGTFNFSDRFTAIVSGTTDKGNSHQAVLDSIRKIGVIPENDLPFGGKNQKEYLGATITQEMLAKAKKFLDIITMSYEFVGSDEVTTNEMLKYSPLCIAITKENPTHAIIKVKSDKVYDSYPPFLESADKSINYAIRLKVTPITEQKYTYFNPKSDPKMIGVSDDLMIRLDAMRSECGFPLKITSGYRTIAYNATLKDAVVDSAHCLGLAVDLACTDSIKRSAIIRTGLKQGITRFGISPTFVHVDIDSNKPQGVMWLY